MLTPKLFPACTQWFTDQYIIHGAKHFTCIISISNDPLRKAVLGLLDSWGNYSQRMQVFFSVICSCIQWQNQDLNPGFSAALTSFEGGREDCARWFDFYWTLLQTWKQVSLLSNFGCTKLRLIRMQPSRDFNRNLTLARLWGKVGLTALSFPSCSGGGGRDPTYSFL